MHPECRAQESLKPSEHRRPLKGQPKEKFNTTITSIIAPTSLVHNHLPKVKTKTICPIVQTDHLLEDTGVLKETAQFR